MLECDTPAAVSAALDDQEDEVRLNVYSALVCLSTGSVRAVRQIVEAGYPGTLVSKAANEVVALQPLALRLLCNCLYDERGLSEALEHSAVETCISQLDSLDTEVRKNTRGVSRPLSR